MGIEYYKEVVEATEENFLEAMRSYLNRMEGYIRDFHKNDDFDIAAALMDTICTETENIYKHRDLYYVARNMLKDLEK